MQPAAPPKSSPRKAVLIIMLFCVAASVAGCDTRAYIHKLYKKKISVTFAETQAMVDVWMDINLKYTDSMTMLHRAVVLHGKDEVIDVLDQAKEDINATTKKGVTPLHLAAILGKTEVIQALIKRGADVNAKTKDGVTPLHLVTVSATTESISDLVRENAYVNVKTNRGWTPLHWAALYGRADVIPDLIRKNADVNAKTNKGWTPLHVAAREGKAEAIQVLIEKCAHIDATDNWRRTPLDWARAKKQWGVVKYLDRGECHCKYSESCLPLTCCQ